MPSTTCLTITLKDIAAKLAPTVLANYGSLQAQEMPVFVFCIGQATNGCRGELHVKHLEKKKTNLSNLICFSPKKGKGRSTFLALSEISSQLGETWRDMTLVDDHMRCPAAWPSSINSMNSVRVFGVCQSSTSGTQPRY